MLSTLRCKFCSSAHVLTSSLLQQGFNGVLVVALNCEHEGGSGLGILGSDCTCALDGNDVLQKAGLGGHLGQRGGNVQQVAAVLVCLMGICSIRGTQ